MSWTQKLGHDSDCLPHGEGVFLQVGSQDKMISLLGFCVKGSDLHSKVIFPTTTHMGWEWVGMGSKLKILLGIAPL